MAQRRMFSPKITSTDSFLDMPVSARELYFQLGMNADDDGFITPKRIMRMVGATDDDLKVLIAKNFVIPFESGVIVISAWRVNNLIRKDWYQETIYKDEKSQLMIDKTGKYSPVNKMLPISLTEYRLGKVINTSETSEVSDDSLQEPDTDIKIDFNTDPETGEPLVDSLGRRKDSKKAPKREGKDKVAIRLVHKFGQMAEKNTGTLPIKDTAGYFLVLDAMNKAYLTEDQIVKLFDDWFSNPFPDEQLVQITRALSHRQVDSWKAQNGIK